MRRARLADMTGGWFVGAFEPSVHATDDVEVAVKSYRAGQVDELHHHRIATEITVIIDGEARMGSTVVRAGDIVVLEPYEATDFEATTDVRLVVVKHPGAPDDKYDGASETP